MKSRRAFTLLFLLTSTLFLLSCAKKTGYTPPLANSSLTQMVSKIPAKRINDPFIFDGIRELQEGNMKKASRNFNRALKFDPQNPHLHFLNALTYQLWGEAGDVTHFENAEVGYRLTLQFDPRNWMAAYQMGLLEFRSQRFRKAQEAFAYGLLLQPKNTELLEGLVAASYYSQDLETALGALQKLQSLRYKNPFDLQAAAIIHAALGEKENARLFYDQFAAIQKGNSFQKENLKFRVNDWKSFFERNPRIQLVQGEDDDDGFKKAGEELFGEKDSSTGIQAKSDDDDEEEDSDKKTNTLKTAPKMALIDVVIIRSEERRTTDKGVNLMNGLQMVLTGDVFDFQRQSTRVGSGDTTTSALDSEKSNVNFKVSLPSGGITYNLNIFNNNEDRNEVLARPTLVALDKETSEFFSGAVFHVQLQGAAGSVGDIEDVPVGIKMSVTPHFINDETLKINVEAARAFLESRSSNAGFSNFSQVTKTRVTSNVAMKFGETLVLSGLSEKEDEFLKDGVPFLQDLPGVQYLFSHEDTLEVTKSVLILITPHKPRYTHQDGTEKISRESPVDKDLNQVNLKELKNRNDWFKPSSNLDATFEHLSDRRMFREFHSGDVKMERWDNPQKLETKIKRTLEFLYY